MTNVVEHKKVLERLGELIDKEMQCAAVILPNNTVWREDLEKTREKSGEKFKVLIMGIFSSGKSSLINALIGEELLPTGFLPETAVIGEMHYGETKKITMYPKKGMWEGGDNPFPLPNPSREEISKYASIDNEAGMNCKADDSDRIKSKFEKMVIEWPLEILKDGVVIVDSPGINDPYNNNYITRSYLPTASAVIYVMNSQQAYAETDKKQLAEINSLGLRNIIFAYSYFDIIAKQSTQSKVEQFKKVLIGHAMEHGELGEDGVHFVSSLEGLEAKMRHDHSLLVHSGYDGMEKYLAKYLVESKGRDQVRVMANAMKIYADAMKKEAATLNKVSTVDSDELEKRIIGAKRQLEIARMNSENTEKNFRRSVKNLEPELKAKVEAFVKGLADSVDLEDYEMETELPSGLGKLNPVAVRRKAKELQEECMDEFKRRMEEALNKWIVNELSPYLTEKEQECAKDIRQDLTNIARQLEDVDLILADGTVKGGSSGTASSYALSITYSILTGDWFTGGIAAAYGKGAMAKAVGAQAAYGFVVSMAISSGIVITWPVFLAGAIIVSIASVLTGNPDKQKAKIAKTVVTESRKGFASDKENQEKNIEKIMQRVKNHMNQLCDDMAQALKKDIQQKEKMIQSTIDEAAAEKESKEKTVKARINAVKELENIGKETDKICAEYNLTE